MKYLSPVANLVRASFSSDVELQALASPAAGATYFSQESGCYYYNPTAQTAGAADLVPESNVGIYEKSAQQLIQVSDDGVIADRNIAQKNEVNSNIVWTGPWTTGQTGTRTIQQVGSVVYLSFSGVEDLGNTPSIILMPGLLDIAYRPSVTQHFVIQVIDNNVKALGTCIVNTEGQVAIYLSIEDNQFTGSGQTGFSNFTVSYLSANQ